MPLTFIPFVCRKVVRKNLPAWDRFVLNVRAAIRPPTAGGNALSSICAELAEHLLPVLFFYVLGSRRVV